MINFVRAGFGTGCETSPKETGVYLVVIESRDGKPFLRVASYDYDTDQWYQSEASEYGYLATRRISSDIFAGWAKLEGISMSLVPEKVELTLKTFPKDEEEE